MPPKPQPKLQVGSPRARRTPVDDKTFEELSSRAEDSVLEDLRRPIEERLPTSDATSPPSGLSSSAPALPLDGSVDDRKARAARLRSSGPANRKGKNGEPYVRKSDGVPTVPQYLTLPSDLVKRLKIHAVENDMKVSDVAAEAIAEYLGRR